MSLGFHAKSAVERRKERVTGKKNLYAIIMANM